MEVTRKFFRASCWAFLPLRSPWDRQEHVAAGRVSGRGPGRSPGTGAAAAVRGTAGAAAGAGGGSRHRRHRDRRGAAGSRAADGRSPTDGGTRLPPLRAHRIECTQAQAYRRRSVGGSSGGAVDAPLHGGRARRSLRSAGSAGPWPAAADLGRRRSCRHIERLRGDLCPAGGSDGGTRARPGRVPPVSRSDQLLARGSAQHERRGARVRRTPQDGGGIHRDRRGPAAGVPPPRLHPPRPAASHRASEVLFCRHRRVPIAAACRADGSTGGGTRCRTGRADRATPARVDRLFPQRFHAVVLAHARRQRGGFRALRPRAVLGAGSQACAARSPGGHAAAQGLRTGLSGSAGPTGLPRRRASAHRRRVVPAGRGVAAGDRAGGLRCPDDGTGSRPGRLVRWRVVAYGG